MRFIIARDRGRASVDLWVVTDDGEKRIGTYKDISAKTSCLRFPIGDTSERRARGAGYWDDIRIGRKLRSGGKLAPPEKLRDVGKELPEIKYPIEVGREKQLFVDDVVIESMRDVTRTQHEATKHPKNPLVIPDKPWEGPSVLLYGSAIKDPRMGGKFRMWYLAWGRHWDLPSYICYAESKDGIEWTKPNLGLMKDSKGSKDNNIVMPGHSDITVLYDPVDPNPAYRYKSMNRYHGHTGFTSPDGIHWKQGKRLIEQAYDCSTVAWDPVGHKWMASLKISRQGKRSRGYAESRDFFNWTDSYLMLHTDDKDLPKDQIYGMIVFRYESLYMGLLRMYHVGTSYKVDIQIASSRNGKHWDRMFRKPIIPTGETLGGWDWGNNSPSTAPPFRVGDELWIYYSGRKNTHSDAGQNPKLGEREWQTAIGLATIRLDGFVSVDGGASEGSLTTKPLQLKGQSLYVNADAAGGQLTAEVIDAATGDVIGAFTKAGCNAVTGGSVKQKVSWSGAANLSSVRNRPVRLRFNLKNAKLYAFWTE